jgi:hypothetical protein
VSLGHTLVAGCGVELALLLQQGYVEGTSLQHSVAVHTMKCALARH